MKQDKSDNKKAGDENEFSPEWLRTFPGCEHYTDEEAHVVLHTLRLLAEWLYESNIPFESIQQPIDDAIASAKTIPLSKTLKNAA